MTAYNVVASSDDSTVVSEYTPEQSESSKYQSEAELEKEFIELLGRQGYSYLPIHSESELIDNLRTQIEKLNDFQFSDNEWDRFFNDVLANTNEGIVEKTRIIQQNNVQVLKRDDGSTKNITIINKKNIHKNYLQVINQYVNNDGLHDNRYDVTILVNGLPLIHIELKRRGIALKEAFNQIDRYQRESFWSSYGLFEYVQIFVISNGTHTKYYSNTTRNSHIAEMNNRKGSKKKTSNSFEFTSYWADANNHIIADLIDFTKTFFARHTILNILTRYCVLTSEDLLLVMRPYQITATERILNRINLATNYHREGTIGAGGYIWHSTGTGKTLTSFKTAILASQLDYIDKVLFVVDRKDLDYQTMREYDRFEKGAANGNTSTKILERQLSDLDEKGNPHEYRIIVTTIQKLSTFVKRNHGHPISNKRIVIIFDECHRSQFGEMHHQITKFFKKYYLFGFTGTPIFAPNANKNNDPAYATTPQLFGDRLHTYTIVNAINDGNVLPFRIDYINTMKMKDESDVNVEAINSESAMLSMKRISQIVSYTLDHYDQKTKRNTFYSYKGKKVSGFNSIFACQSIPAAIRYYSEFRKQIDERNADLKIATIFSYAANEEQADGILEEENFDTSMLDATGKEALFMAMSDYDQQFHSNFAVSGDFEAYYKDISMRMKNREIDILIVVNMFLTGFDATTLSTLWCDKNLKMHGLIQAFSRTNRILNSVKTFGNIVCFRNLSQEVEDAISLFGDKDAGSIVLLKDYKSYYDGYEEEDGRHHKGYSELINELLSKYPPDTEPFGEKQEKEFIAIFGSILRVMNILNSFDQFENDKLLTDRQMQDFQSRYLDLYKKYRRKTDKADIEDDVIFEIELVKQIEVNIDYILNLVQKYHNDNCLDDEATANILKAVDSSVQLRSKKELIAAFLARVNLMSSDEDKKVTDEWQSFVKEKYDDEVTQLIADEKLKEDKTRSLLDKSFDQGELKTGGTAIDDCMPPMSRFGGGRAKKKLRIIDKFKTLFEKFSGIM